MLVVGLGVAWVLDGLEITIASNVTNFISSKQALSLSSSEWPSLVGPIGTVAAPLQRYGCSSCAGGSGHGLLSGDRISMVHGACSPGREPMVSTAPRSLTRSN
jgi:hypothetical protein